jgi:hypothetical protein
MGIRRMNVCNGPGTPRSALPRPEAEAKLLKEDISLLWEAGHWKENVVILAALESYEED